MHAFDHDDIPKRTLLQEKGFCSWSWWSMRSLTRLWEAVHTHSYSQMERCLLAFVGQGELEALPLADERGKAPPGALAEMWNRRRSNFSFMRDSTMDAGRRNNALRRYGPRRPGRVKPAVPYGHERVALFGYPGCREKVDEVV